MTIAQASARSRLTDDLATLPDVVRGCHAAQCAGVAARHEGAVSRGEGAVSRGESPADGESASGGGDDDASLAAGADTMCQRR